MQLLLSLCFNSQETKQMLEEQSFFPLVDHLSPTSKSIPIPRYKLAIPRNTFYLEPLMATAIRILEERPTKQDTASTLSVESEMRNQGTENLLNT